MLVNVRYVRARTMLSPTRLGADFVVNPYAGCPHGCIYCYAACLRRGPARPERWGEYLDVREPSAPVDLAKVYGKTILFSSLTDAYNPFEERALATRGLLEELLPARPVITVITKSALVLRDAELLAKFPRAKVVFSFSSLDDGFRRAAEPHASSPAKKLEAMRRLREAGIETGVFVAPVFPEITNCAAIIDAAEPYADSINFDSLNLRPQNRESVLSFIKERRPELGELYDAIYLRGDRSWWHHLRAELERLCEGRGFGSSIFF